MAKLKAGFADYCLGIHSGMGSICAALASIPLQKLHAIRLARVNRPMANPFVSPPPKDQPRVDYAGFHTSPILGPRSNPLMGTPPSLSIDEMGDKTQSQLRALSHEQVIQVCSRGFDVGTCRSMNAIGSMTFSSILIVMIPYQVATEFRAKIFHLERERSMRDVYIKQLMDKINYLTQQLRNSAAPMQYSQSPESNRHAFRNSGTPPRHQESPQVGAPGPRPSPITSEGAALVGHPDATSGTAPSHHRYSDSRQQYDSLSPAGSGLGAVGHQDADQNNIGRSNPAHTRTHKPRQKAVLGTNGDSDGRSKRGNNSGGQHRKNNQASINANNSDNSHPQRSNSKKNGSKNGHNNRGKGRQRGRGRGRGNNRGSRRSAAKKGAQNQKS